MVWSQFSIKILGGHFGDSVLSNNNWDKVNDNLTKKKSCFEQSVILFEREKK